MELEVERYLKFLPLCARRSAERFVRAGKEQDRQIQDVAYPEVLTRKIRKALGCVYNCDVLFIDIPKLMELISDQLRIVLLYEFLLV